MKQREQLRRTMANGVPRCAHRIPKRKGLCNAILVGTCKCQIKWLGGQGEHQAELGVIRDKRGSQDCPVLPVIELAAASSTRHQFAGLARQYGD